MVRMPSAIVLAAALIVVFILNSPEVGNAQIAPTNTATVTGSVVDSTGKPLGNAVVSLKGPRSSSTHADSRGRFVFVGMPVGTYEMTASSSLGTVVQTISIEGDVDVEVQYPAVTAIKTIASVLVGGRFNVTPASITQVSPSAAAFDGVTSWRKIMEKIPGVAQGGLGIGNKVTATYADAPYMPMQISINGTLPYETATLLDNMPVIGSSLSNGTSGVGMGTDLAVYPMNGFDTADVVRGPGANAPSIVDSIGGSFVLHAPGPVTTNHYAFSLSTDPYGGVVANTRVALRQKKLSAVITYGVNDSPGPVEGLGFTTFATAPTTINGMPFSCTGSCATASTFSPIYSGGLVVVNSGLIACCVAYTSAWSVHSGSASLSYAASPAIRADLFYAGQGQEFALPGANNAGNFTPPSGYTGSIAAGSQLFPTSGSNSLGLASFSPFNQAASLFEEKITANVGKGVLRFAALQNNVFLNDTIAPAASATVQLFGGGKICASATPACGSAANPGTATVFNGGTYTITRSAPVSSVFFGTNNRDQMMSYATPLGDYAHAGLSFVKSSYTVPLTVNGAVSVPDAVSLTTRETRFSIGGNPSNKSSLDLSMYFVRANYHVQNPSDPTKATYTDADYSYSAPRLGFVWRPTENIAFRAAAGGGFAEAPLKDLVGSNGLPQPNSSTSPTFYTVSFQNLGLQPEKSFGFDVGADIRFPHNTIVSLDVYRSNLFGQIYSSTALAGTFTGSAGTLPLYVTEFGNLGESRYEGILLDARHETPRGVYWTVSGGLTRGYVVSLPAGFYNTAGSTCNTATNAGCKNQTVVPNINFNGTFAAAIPYAQGLGSIGYRWNRERFVNLIATYYGNNNTYYRPAFVELDANAGIPLMKDSSLLFTLRNITGVYGGGVQLLGGSVLTGAPTIAGQPQALYQQNYGPRTLVLTLKVNTQ